MKLTLLGTGCPSVDYQRCGSSNLISTKKTKILIDCGSGVTQRLNQSGNSSADIDALLLTHLHTDHVIDLYQLIISSWHSDRDSIWKAAVVAHREGRLPMLSDHLEQQSLLNNQLYENEDPFLEPIQRKIESWNKGHKFSTRDILIDSELRDGNKITPADMNTAARILKSLGCIRDKNQTRNSITGDRKRLWNLPQADSPD